MKKQDITYNDTVKEALAVALIQIMMEKKISTISISEIVEKAGVSRSSFYRNFDNKEEILIDYIQKRYKTYFKKELNSTLPTDMQTFLLYRFKFIRYHKNYFIALRKNNLLNYLFEEMDHDLANFLSGNRCFKSPYHKAVFASCSAGIIRQWIDNNFKESEQEIIDLHITLSASIEKN